MTDLKIIVKKLRGNAKIPKFAFKDDAGADCYVSAFKDIEENKDLTDKESFLIEPYHRVLCLLGFATIIPKGYYAQVLPKSGLSLKYGITILNAIGIIDAGYRNEWGAIMINLSKTPYRINVTDKICQTIIRKLEVVEFIEGELNDTERGLGGFGSTGLK